MSADAPGVLHDIVKQLTNSMFCAMNKNAEQVKLISILDQSDKREKGDLKRG